MRSSLNKIELVDNYLTGKLSGTEKENFIKALESDAELKELLKIQKELLKAVQRKALKSEINHVIKISKWKKFIKWLTGAVIAVAIVVGITVAYNNNSPESDTKTILNKENEQPISTPTTTAIMTDTTAAVTDDNINFNGLNTWVQPHVQTFWVNPTKGATIEGKEGTLVIVPADAFLNKNNTIVTESVWVELLEALTLEDMVLYNLGTTADGKALETGGMLHFNFTCAGKEVKINPKRPLYVEVPTKKVKNDMMVFEGEIKKGKVNWKNPKPMKKYLVTVDFNLLDFLPTGFADTVETLIPYKGHKNTTATLMDSLYYSLGFCETSELIEMNQPYRKLVDMPIWNRKEKQWTDKDTAANTIVEKTKDKYSGCCGIEPIAIKTIKTKPYAQTFIATREFEERIKALHKLDNGNDLLKIYIDHLSENLSDVDATISTKITGKAKKQFDAFAKQGLTNIKDAQIYQEQLSAYYTNKQREYKTALERIRSELSTKNRNELNQLLNNNTTQAQLTTALVSQLPKTNVTVTPTYAFQWASSGWVNIDCYLHLLSYGSEKVAMNISNAEGAMEVYQWLNTINNLTPLMVNDNKATALFPLKNSEYAKAMTNTFCFAISRNNRQYKWFDIRYNPYEKKVINVKLQASSLEEIKSKLQTYSVKNDLEERLNKIDNEVLRQLQLKAKLAQIKKDNEIKNKLREAAFPCKKYNREIQIKDSDEVFD